MLIMTRDMDYPELMGALEGKKAAIWTCNTCARLCNGIGGTESSERLASRLREDGIGIQGVYSTSASCIESRVMSRKSDVTAGEPDAILCLTCSVGAHCAEKVFGIDCINPIRTLGYGILSEDGTPILFGADGYVPVSELSDKSSPFV